MKPTRWYPVTILDVNGRRLPAVWHIRQRYDGQSVAAMDMLWPDGVQQDAAVYRSDIKPFQATEEATEFLAEKMGIDLSNSPLSTHLRRVARSMIGADDLGEFAEMFEVMRQVVTTSAASQRGGSEA